MTWQAALREAARRVALEDGILEVFLEDRAAALAFVAGVAKVPDHRDLAWRIDEPVAAA